MCLQLMNSQKYNSREDRITAFKKGFQKISETLHQKQAEFSSNLHLLRGAIYHGLGNAYRCRIVGKKHENIEDAIHFCKIALEIRTKESNREDWASTIVNLGSAYQERIQGEPRENLRIAIDLYLEAQKVLKPKTLPWAKLQNNLGLIYSSSLLINQKNLEESIFHLKKALEFYQKDTHGIAALSMIQQEL